MRPFRMAMESAADRDQQDRGQPAAVVEWAAARRRGILRVYFVTVIGLLVTSGISTSLVRLNADFTHGKAATTTQRLVADSPSLNLLPFTPSTNPEKLTEHNVASYVFLHIPKCGGTSVRDRIVNVLQEKLALQEITGNFLDQGLLRRSNNNNRTEFWVNTMEGGQVPVDRLAHELPQKDRNRIRLLAGHVAYGACNILRPPCRYMTVLRDPRARMISEVKWIQHVYAHDPSIANLTVSEFIEGAVDAKGPTKRFCVLLDNHETRLLSGDSYSGMFEINGRPKTPCLGLNQTIANRAIEHVTHDMFHAGLLEDLDEFFNGLGDKFEEVDFGYAGTKLNAASKSESSSMLTPDAESLLAQMIQWDTQVYEALRTSQH